MRARVLFTGLVSISTVVFAGPASGKADIAEANIIGPGLGGGMKIEAPDTDGLWESGIDVAGGLDDTRSDSGEELGFTPADLGPRYLVTYDFGTGTSDGLIRQDLYPFAKGGPVTYTPPGQEPTAGVKMSITAGWYRSSLGFFHFLVDHGLPGTNPATPATRRPVPGTTSAGQAVPWAGIVVVLVGLAALSPAALAVRPRGWRRPG